MLTITVNGFWHEIFVARDTPRGWFRIADHTGSIVWWLESKCRERPHPACIELD